MAKRWPLSYLKLTADRNSVTQGNQHGIELFRRVDQAVEFLHTPGVLVVVGCWARGLAGPNRVVGNEQSAATQLGQRRAKRLGILVFVNIIEDHVELARRLFHEFQRISNLYF